MWLDRTRNVLIYDAPQPDCISKTIPGARRLINGHVACPFTLFNLQILRHFGYEVPPPMNENYDWPGLYTPFLAQRVTANFLTVHPRAFVLSDMGTGKTLAALWAADYVMRQHDDGACRALIVCPLSTLQRVWADAIFTHFVGRRNAVVLHGTVKKRQTLLAKDADFYIINFDGLQVIRNELAAREDIRMAIVDEASAYRARNTKRHKLARALLAPKSYLWMMTGTPIPNGPLDAYGMAKLINNAYGESYLNYQNRTMFKVSMWKWLPKTGSHDAAMKLLSPAVRFSIEQCIDLPAKTVQQRECELSVEQHRAYKEMKRDLVLQAKEGPITAANEAVLRMKLIQISCGCIYGPDRVVTVINPGPRISALKEVIEQAGEKIIVFAPLTSVLHMLHKELSVQWTCEIVNGEVSHGSRSKIFGAFQQDADPRILIADPATMAHGLTLTAATVIVWYAPTSTELYLQANKRIHRPGQSRACTIVQIASTPIEREIYRRLEANETLQGVMLKMIEGRSNESDTD